MIHVEGILQILGERETSVRTDTYISEGESKQIRCAKMWWIFVILAINLVGGQKFAPPGYEEVTDEAMGSFGAQDKCGQGESTGSICVPYHMCDGRTNTVVPDSKSSGFGIIDIRFGVNSCEHPLDVCCKRAGEGLESSTSRDTPEIPSPSPPPPPPPGVSFCGIRNSNGIDFKSTGNNHNEAEYGEFPWMVAILRRNYNPSVDETLAICGGSLIHPRVVLTGAHCVYNYKINDLKIRAGEWDTQTDKERLPYQERDIERIIIHDEFNSKTLFNDFALLVLTKNVKKAENVGTVCLPDQGELISSQNCFASGWGKDIFGRDGQYQVILKRIELPTVEHHQCQQSLRTTRLGQHFNLDGSFICAGGNRGQDTCTGDGGSPLVCPDPKNPTRYVQAGIVAWGIGCHEGTPGVYADVAKFRNWIDENMSRLNLNIESYTL